VVEVSVGTDRRQSLQLSELLHHPHYRVLPSSARDAIVRRVAGLGAAAFDVLTAAAVAGERCAALIAYDHAMSALAYEVAVSFAEMALDAIAKGAGNESDSAEAILRRGRAHIRSGDLHRGIADCRLALELANRHDLRRIRVEAVLGWAEASPVWGRQPELPDALEHALDAGVDAVGRHSSRRNLRNCSRTRRQGIVVCG
jgi:hypothetical protein